jgi:hypothetical protein
MSRFHPAEGLSERARSALKRMAESGSSEAYSVAEALNTIAENDDESAADEFLVACAREIRGWAVHFIEEVRESPAGSPARLRPAPTEPSGKTFYRTLIEVEVLSEEPVEFDSLEDVHNAIVDGDCSGKWDVRQ